MRCTSWFLLGSTLSLSALALSGCGKGANVQSSPDDITQVKQSGIKDQSIGNCWSYASVGWIESLVKSANGTELNLSESWINYWYWFEQITEQNADTITEGGSWGITDDVVLRYGIPNGGDFIPAEATAIRSAAQATALAAIKTSLKSGALSKSSARSDRKLVRSELDKAWGLTPDVIAMLDKTFGPDVSKTLDKGAAVPDGVPLKLAKDFPAKLKDPATSKVIDATVADAMGTAVYEGYHDYREGKLAWTTVSYPPSYDAKGRRDFLKRIQRALHDEQPAILSWYVDFNAMTSDGKFLKPPATPGPQGGHMVIFEDYEIDNVPGFGTLPAGVLETRPEALAAALDDAAQIKFFRIKNSWGNYKPSVMVGYHDLYMGYLNGPIQQCQTDENEKPIPNSCHEAVPFEDALLPAGY